jgi:hypothetical protein
MNENLPNPEVEGRKYRKKVHCFAVQMNRPFTVQTLEGEMSGREGDYLLKGVKGELWPVRKEIFEQTYEEVS